MKKCMCVNLNMNSPSVEDYIKRAFRYYGAASAEHRINDIAKMAALLILNDLRRKVCPEMNWDFYNSMFYYAEDGMKAAISRMLARGHLIEARKGYIKRPNSGPSRECCYRIFSDVCLMDGPTYKELGHNSWPYTEYHTD